MLYHAYQTYIDSSEGLRLLARMGLAAGKMLNGFNGFTGFGASHSLFAALELTARSKFTHTRPPYGIDRVAVGGRKVRALSHPRMEEAGAHLCVWDGRDDRATAVAGGVYFVAIEVAGQRPVVRKVEIVR